MEMVTNATNASIAIKWEVLYTFSFGIFTVVLGKMLKVSGQGQGQAKGQGHACFDCEYFINGDLYGIRYY